LICAFISLHCITVDKFIFDKTYYIANQKLYCMTISHIYIYDFLMIFLWSKKFFWNFNTSGLHWDTQFASNGFILALSSHKTSCSSAAFKHKLKEKSNKQRDSYTTESDLCLSWTTEKYQMGENSKDHSKQDRKRSLSLQQTSHN